MKSLLNVAAFLWLLVAFQQVSTGVEGRPNVVVILADDLGYGDTTVFDGWVKTPQLERMACEGLTFTDFHTNSSVCSPTRAAFLTGRYQQRVGIVDVIARLRQEDRPASSTADESKESGTP